MTVVAGVRLTEAARARLALILAVVNWVSILTSLALVGLGAYIKLSVSEFTNLVKDYDGNSLPFLLIGVGLISAVINAAGGLLLFLMSTNPARRAQFSMVLIAYMALSACVCICVLAGGIMCYTHVNHLRGSFKGGLRDAMQHYADTPHIKEELDLLQSSYRCCGNDRYTDWFHIPWVKAKFSGTTKAKSTHDNVPWSCCNPESQRPCIHTSVHDNSAHHHYDYKSGVTLHLTGCRQALMDYFGGNLLPEGGAVVLSVFFLQIVLTLVARILQTGIAGALEQGDPTAPATGYLFMFGDEGSKAMGGAQPGMDEAKAPLLADDDVNMDVEGGGSHRASLARLSHPSVAASHQGSAVLSNAGSRRMSTRSQARTMSGQWEGSRPSLAGLPGSSRPSVHSPPVAARRTSLAATASRRMSHRAGSVGQVMSTNAAAYPAASPNKVSSCETDGSWGMNSRSSIPSQPPPPPPSAPHSAPHSAHPSVHHSVHNIPTPPPPPPIMGYGAM